MTGLYVHWPFCLSKCPYCDFNSHVRENVEQERWRAALLRELEHAFESAGPGRLGSIFFGGGTPSLMEPATAGAVIERAAALWDAAPDIEITLEANPTSVEARRLADFRAAGINRVSLGVQALDDRALAFLGRGHSAAEALAAVDIARRLFPRFSFDLIYARPGQTPAAWSQELDRAIERAGDHLSVYQLTMEPGTIFYKRWQRGGIHMPDQETGAALYEITQARLSDAGLPAYEISNHARPGGECRHNLIYWGGGAYAGIGPGAHGRVGPLSDRRAVARLRAPELWLHAVESQGHGTESEATLSPHEQIVERLMMGLRLTDGLDYAALESDFGPELDTAMDRNALSDLREAGLIERANGRLVASDAGRQRLDAVLGHLLSG